MACSCAARKMPALHWAAHRRIECIPGARLFHGLLVHTITTRQMLGTRHPLRAGLRAMHGAKGQRSGEQDQQANEVGPGLCHSAAMLPKPIAVRQYGPHRAELPYSHGIARAHLAP